MSNPHLNSLLNDLLIELHRSLPEYIAEAWPWTTSEDVELKQTVERIAQRQQAGVARLVQLLRDRGHDIDFGTYPQEYTSLHYVALEFLFSSLKTSQREFNEWIWGLLPEVAEDPQAEQVVREIGESQRRSVQELDELNLEMDAQAVAWMK